jgi:DNA-binding SARP family transcriptional activator/Tol biopolymer transport system component
MLRLRTLGGLSIENAVSAGGLTAHRRPLAVLALLAAEGRRGLSRDKIVALLWPESDSERGRNSLSQVISLLRRELSADDIVLGAAEVRLNTAVITSDVIEFEERIAANDLEGAIGLYEGPFLDGVFLKNTPDFERWVDHERSRLHHLQSDALERLATRAATNGDHASAVRFRRQRAGLTPSDSRAAYKLMESLVALGDPAGALEHYRVHQLVLRDDLDLEPDAALAEFAAAIRRGMTRPTVGFNEASPSPVAFALQGATAVPDRVELVETRALNASRARRAVWNARAVIVAMLATAALVWQSVRGREGSVSYPPSDLTHLLPDSTSLHSAAISPDGRTIVYAAVHDGTLQNTRLYLLKLGALQARPLENTEGAAYPFFSPDGASVGFSVRDAMKRIALADGGITTITTNMGLGGTGRTDASWSDDGYILFGSNMDRQINGIRRVPAQGGTVEMLSRPDGFRGETSHYSPQQLPGTDTFIHSVTTSGARGRTHRVVAQRLGGGAARILVEGANLARYIDGGWLAYQIGSDLFVSRLDVNTFALSEPNRVAEVNPSSGRSWAANARVLLYQPKVETRSMLVRVSRDGTRDTLSARADNYDGLDLSPSGDRIVTLVRDGGLYDVWTFDFSKSEWMRISSDGITGGPVKWSADGKRLTIRRRSNTGLDLYTRAADGSDTASLLFSNGGVVWPADWTRDMRTLVVMQHDTVSNGGDLWTLDTATKTLRPLVRSDKQDFGGRLSPDGRWAAYFSDVSGRYELYVIPFPDAAQRWQVSQDGGHEAVWSRDGRELFFRNGKKMMVAAIRPGTTFDWDPPRVLFEGDFYTGGGPGNEHYDVTPDGKHFLMLAVPPPGPPRLNVFQGWLTLGSVARR